MFETASFEERYGALLSALIGAAGELTAADDLTGLRFLIECVDAIFGRALQLIELRHAQEAGRLN